MDKDLADLIEQYDEEIFPYLKLRSLYTLRGKNDIVTINVSEIPQESLEDLKISGFVNTNSPDSKGDMIVQLSLDGRWLYQPPEIVRKTKEKSAYIPKGLEKLAETLGYPDDWEHKLSKYVGLYINLSKLYPPYLIQSVAEWTKKNNATYTINVILTKDWFKSLKHKMENPKQLRHYDRVAEENYNEKDTEEFLKNL